MKSRPFIEWSPVYTLLLGLAVGLLLGTAITAAGATEDTEQPSVSCTTFIDEAGDASGMCFVYGDVEFEWLDEQNATSDELSLAGLPAENSTVRRKGA